MRGKWAAGISPRNFAWIIKDQLAISERPGGYARSHRPVRRQEEIIWIREQGFHRVVSLLPSPHNLHAYDNLGVAWEHLPLGPHDDARVVLSDLYPRVRGWLGAGEKILIHQEEMSDRIELRGLRATGTHGALPEEWERAQPFEVDIDLAVDLRAAGASDDLGHTVDYGAVSAAVARVVTGERHRLLERLAERIAEDVRAADGRVRSVTVAVRKLRPPVPVDLGSAGVRITRP